jgi:flagellar hook-basal body complex protein FliE
MANLNVENLNRIVQTGDVEALMTGGVSRTNVSAPSEARVVKEMQAQGMEAPSAGKGETFSDMLRHSVEQVNQEQVQANQAIHELVAGRSKNIHETMLAVERADTSLKLMMQVRNKVLDAYREIMKMQV